MREGKILWFNADKGFGIIESNEERFLIHESDVLNDKKIKKLTKQRTVKFREDRSSDSSSFSQGLRRAKDVEIV